MPMTLEEINAREDELLDQIAECKRLLAAYQVLRAEHEKSLLAASDPMAGDETGTESHPEPAAPPVWAPPVYVPPPPARLEELRKGYGGGIRATTWAIQRMTGDFNVRNIAAELRQAGQPMRARKLSVILNRMKVEKKILQVTKGRGRTPSLFRATAAITAQPLELCARHRSGMSTADYCSAVRR